MYWIYTTLALCFVTKVSVISFSVCVWGGGGSVLCVPTQTNMLAVSQSQIEANFLTP